MGSAKSSGLLDPRTSGCASTRRTCESATTSCGTQPTNDSTPRARTNAAKRRARVGQTGQRRRERLSADRDGRVRELLTPEVVAFAPARLVERANEPTEAVDAKRARLGEALRFADESWRGSRKPSPTRTAATSERYARAIREIESGLGSRHGHWGHAWGRRTVRAPLHITRWSRKQPRPGRRI